MQRLFLQLAGLNGLLAVALGAFGAHGLKGILEISTDSVERAERLAWWNLAAHYQLTHALALGLLGLFTGRLTGRLPRAAGWSFQLGILLFCGSLYAMGLGGSRTLGAVTPLGGLGFLAGWTLLILCARKLPREQVAG